MKTLVTFDRMSDLTLARVWDFIKDIEYPIIKPLEWHGNPPQGELLKEFASITARTPFGAYNIVRRVEKSEWESEYLLNWCFDEYYDEGQFEAKSIEEAKQIANEHWIERLSPCLNLGS